MGTYRFFIPHAEAALKREEKEILYKDDKMIKKLYLAKPAILSINEKGDIQHQEFPLLKTRYLVGELAKGNQLVLFEAHQMQKPYGTGEKSYFIDIYFQPLFGGIALREFLFVPVKQEERVSRSCILFSVTKKE